MTLLSSARSVSAQVKGCHAHERNHTFVENDAKAKNKKEAVEALARTGDRVHAKAMKYSTISAHELAMSNHAMAVDFRALMTYKIFRIKPAAPGKAVPNRPPS